MTRFERAVQMWSLLALSAGRHQTLTYDELAELLDVPRSGLGRLLEPVQSYCILKALPPLTSLVVSARTGVPGDGFMASRDLPQAQAEVFGFDWPAKPVPTPENFEAAVAELPSLGLSLRELMREIHEKKCH